MNHYLAHKIPVTTWFEGLFMLIFMGMVGLNIWAGTYAMLPFHLMLAVGYGLVFVSSFQAYGLGK